jgi:RNA 3'-phosphate cyclase
MITVDGSYLEGGGAILRTAIGLSTITGKPARITNIRKNRPQAGLKTQHLEGLKTVATLCSAEVTGARLGSTEIEFHPKDISTTTATVTIGTAGSVGLVFQSLKLLAYRATETMKIAVNGGATFGKFSPPMLYIQHVLLPILATMGYSATIVIEKHGFYPKGGARVTIIIDPWEKRLPLMLTTHSTSYDIHCRSIASSDLQRARVAERQAAAVENALMKWMEDKSNYSASITCESDYTDATCPGSGIVLWAQSAQRNILGADGLGERGKPAETVGKEAAITLIRAIESGAAVDEHLSDQLLVFMALAKEKSIITIPHLTDHAKTNIRVIQQFIDTEFTITKKDTYTSLECAGST